MIALLTCDGRPYYRAAAEAVSAQAAGMDVDLFVDGTRGPEYVPTGWRVHLHPRGAPNNGDAFWRVLRAAEAAGDDLVFFEDDIELTAGAVEYMVGFPVPADLALVTFLSSAPSAVAPWGLYRLPGLTFAMCQALKIPARGVRAILGARPQPVNHVADIDVQSALAVTRARFGVHVPELVRHVGEVSAANPGAPLAANRVGHRWPGAGFDPRRQLRSAHELGLYL